MYVIQRDDGAFATPYKEKREYTFWLQDARTFATLEKAKAECCRDNEIVTCISDLLRQPE